MYTWIWSSAHVYARGRKQCCKIHYCLWRVSIKPKLPITKTRLYNVDPLKPHFYIVKLGFTGVYIIGLISAQKHRLWYSLELPRRGGSNEYPQSMFWAEIWKISEFLSEKFHVLVVNFSVYLNRLVFIMHFLIRSVFLVSKDNLFYVYFTYIYVKID